MSIKWCMNSSDRSLEDGPSVVISMVEDTEEEGDHEECSK